MKSTAVRRKSNSQASGNVINFGTPAPDVENPLQHIAIAAYFKAEARRFAPGLELDDWLEAEAELSRRRE